MQRNVFHRAFSFCLAAVMTMAVLGAVDHLAQPDVQAAQAPQWAQAAAAKV